MKRIITLILFSSSVFSSSVALAAPVTWTLTDVTFSDGGTASGFFVFDADTDTVTNWDISTTVGSVLGAFEYTTADSIVANATASLIAFESDLTFPNGLGSNENRVLDLGFVTTLTDAGGTVNLVANEPFGGDSNGSGECLDCDPFRTVTGGSVTTTPEPGFTLLAGMLLLGAVACRARVGRSQRHA